MEPDFNFIIILFPTIIMNFAIVALIAAVEARHHHHNDASLVALAGTPPTVGLGHAIIPANREDYDNAKELWKGDWAKYRTAYPNDQDCSISESDNWKGAQQCSQSWECRGARMCERGGWCSGYDGCEGTPLPDQAPGLAPDF
jgi:hypothetical protein